MSIFLKYSLWLSAILLVAAGAVTGAALWFQYDSMTRQSLLRGQSIAVNLASPASDALLRRNDLQLISLALNATKDHQDVVYAAILDSRGRVVGHPDPKALGQTLDFKESKTLKTGLKNVEVREGLAHDIEVWDIRVPVLLIGTQKVLGQISVGMAVKSVTGAVKSSLWRLALISFLLMLAGVALVGSAVKLLVAPLRDLSSAAQDVGRGDFGVRVKVQGRDELGVLAANFNEMVEGLQQAEKARAEHQRIESELALARQIQASLLPERPPRVAGLDVAFRCQPAKELGGDFYDCFPIGKGLAWGFLIADVSGKGVPAALHMANLRNVFRLVASDETSPLAAVKKVNAVAFSDLKGENFVTMIYAVIHADSGQVRLVNAGHDPAYWISARGEIKAFEATALPLGLVEAEDYDGEAHESQFSLGVEDRFFVYTDGVTEAMDSASSQFGLDRLKACVLPPATALETVTRVVSGVEEHTRGLPAADDITLLTVRRTA